MTPAAKPREHTTHFDDCGCLSERLRAECARWRECAEALADGCQAATHEANDYNCQDWPPGNGCSGCDGDEKRKAALAHFDVLVDEGAGKWCTCNDEHTCEGHRA